MSLETDNGKLILLELVGGKITEHITIDNPKSHPLIKIETVFFVLLSVGGFSRFDVNIGFYV